MCWHVKHYKKCNHYDPTLQSTVDDCLCSFNFTSEPIHKSRCPICQCKRQLEQEAMAEGMDLYNGYVVQLTKTKKEIDLNDVLENSQAIGKWLYTEKKGLEGVKLGEELMKALTKERKAGIWRETKWLDMEKGGLRGLWDKMANRAIP